MTSNFLIITFIYFKIKEKKKSSSFSTNKLLNNVFYDYFFKENERLLTSCLASDVFSAFRFSAKHQRANRFESTCRATWVQSRLAIFIYFTKTSKDFFFLCFLHNTRSLLKWNSVLIFILDFARVFYKLLIYR